MKILVIHQDGLISGSAISLKFMLHGLKREGFDLHLVLSGPGPLEALLRAEGFAPVVIPLRGFWTAPGPKWYRRGALLNLLSLLPSPALINYVKRVQPDLIHLNDKALIGAGLALRSLGIPIVQHLRSTYEATNTPAFVALSKKAIEAYAAALVGISQDEIAEFPTFPQKSVIFNSLDTEAIEIGAETRAALRSEFGLPEEQKLVVYVGLFSRTKGAWDFMDMVAEYLRKYDATNVRFMMVGKLPDKSAGLRKLINLGSENDAWSTLQEKLDRDGLRQKIILTGYRKDVLQLIHAADVMVMCNRLGAMGRQALEANAAGTPLVITAGHSGKSEVVIHEKNGLVVEAENSTKLAAELHRVLSQPELAARLAAGGTRYAQENFDYRKNGEKLGRLYKTIAGRGAAATG